MTEHVHSLSSDIADLAQHIRRSPRDGDFRKERSKLGERHHRDIAQVNALLVERLHSETTDEEYEQLRRAVGSFLN